MSQKSDPKLSQIQANKHNNDNKSCQTANDSLNNSSNEDSIYPDNKSLGSLCCIQFSQSHLSFHLKFISCHWLIQEKLCTITKNANLSRF